MTHDEIINHYSWQFSKGRRIDNSVPCAWLPVLEELCAAIERVIPEEERSVFHWLDIKEKRGKLAVDYVAPAHAEDAIDALVESASERLSNV